MIWLLLLMSTPQATAAQCLGSDNALDCSAPDGSRYIERRLGSQVIRQGVDQRGNTWTEYVIPVFDGTRTSGVDSTGRTWARHCNPRFGTTGNTRTGETIFIPPPPPPRARSDGQATSVNACN